MVVPAGEPIRLVLRSDDVIHSFFVPAFLVKMDVIPFGQDQRPNELEFTVKEPGTYRGQCAEFCGDLHAGHDHRDAMPPAEFATWLEDASAATPSPPEPSILPDIHVVELAENIAFDSSTWRCRPASRSSSASPTSRTSSNGLGMHDTTIFEGPRSPARPPSITSSRRSSRGVPTSATSTHPADDRYPRPRG